MLVAQIDMREQRSVIGRHADTGTIKDLRLRDLRRGRRQHAVKRQEGPVDREGRLGRAAQIGAQEPFGQRKTAPWPPFVHVAHQDRGLTRFAEHILADRAQLRPTQDLHQRQMHADKAEFLAVAGQVRDDRAAMATTGQIKQCDTLDLNVRAHKDDGAQKPVTVIRPTMRRIAMQIVQPRRRLDRRNIQQSAMRRDLFIGLLQDQRIYLVHRHLGPQGGQSAGRVYPSVVAATAVNVPAQAGKVLISIGQYLAFVGNVLTLGQGNDSLNTKKIDMIGEINVCS